MSSIWGKIVGGAAGFALGGPLGALLGALGGHVVDRRFSRNSVSANRHNSIERQAIFTMALVSLGAKMAKADGTVTRDEVDTFKRVFQIQEQDMKNVGKLFDLAKQDIYGFDVYAKQIAGLLKNEPDLLREILWCLTQIAKADGVIHPNEREYLAQVAAIFGVGASEFERITQVSLDGENNDPYKVLGVSPKDDMETIKKTYRELVRKNHPDRLMAKGVPPEVINIANQKISLINNAYSEIEKLRKH